MAADKLKLLVAAARFRLGTITSDELRQVADDALWQGLYSHALGELSMLRQPVLSEAGPLFQKVLGELDKTSPWTGKLCRLHGTGSLGARAEMFNHPDWPSPGLVASDRLPELATALEEAGCDDASLLAYLRGPGARVRGCWARSGCSAWAEIRRRFVFR